MPYFSIYNVDSAKTEIEALAEAENELMMIERDLKEAEKVQIFAFLLIFSLFSFCYKFFDVYLYDLFRIKSIMKELCKQKSLLT